MLFIIDFVISSKMLNNLQHSLLFHVAELVESPETLLHNGCTQSIATTSSPSTSSQATSTTTATSKSSDKRRSSTEQKQPRIRTVLTEQQLQTLRSVYQTNPRPDALLKEQLCELTGLSPRVIRVWFQNRRCKDKKALQKAEAARLQSGSKVSILCFFYLTMTFNYSIKICKHAEVIIAF